MARPLTISRRPSVDDSLEGGEEEGKRGGGGGAGEEGKGWRGGREERKMSLKVSR